MASKKAQELALLGSISFSLILTLVVLAYITVALRIWVRCRITKSPGWDDAAMVATLVRGLTNIATNGRTLNEISYYSLLTVHLSWSSSFEVEKPGPSNWEIFILL